MKKYSKALIINAILILTVFLSFAENNTKVDSSRIVKVLTFNIYHGETYYRDHSLPYESNLDIIAEVINSIKPDLVAMQEVDFKTNRAKGLDLMTELGVKTGMAPLFGKAMKYDGGEYGEGILSRHSFVETKNYPLYASENKEPRAALSAIIELPCGELVRFIGTHLDHTSNVERLDQAKQLNKLFGNDAVPSFMAGDLNSLSESPTMQTLFKKWSQSSSDNAPTIPSLKPTHKVDYILYRPANRWRIIESRVIDEKKASDHNPVLTIFEILPK